MSGDAGKTIASLSILAALRERELGERVFLPRVMFGEPPSAGEEQGLRTLDDLTVVDFRERLGRPVVLEELLSEFCDD